MQLEIERQNGVRDGPANQRVMGGPLPGWLRTVIQTAKLDERVTKCVAIPKLCPIGNALVKRLPKLGPTKTVTYLTCNDDPSQSVLWNDASIAAQCIAQIFRQCMDIRPVEWMLKSEDRKGWIAFESSFVQSLKVFLQPANRICEPTHFGALPHVG
jgi:hypothetical protein